MYVYLLESNPHPDRIYVGITQNLGARLQAHNSGQCPTTSKLKPWKLKTAIWFDSKERAIQFEKYLKTGSGRAFGKGITQQIVPQWSKFGAGKRLDRGTGANPYCQAFLRIPSPTRPQPSAPADSNGSFRMANSHGFPNGSQPVSVTQSFRYEPRGSEYSNNLHLEFRLPDGSRGFVWCWKTSARISPWTLGDLRGVFGDRPGELGGILRFQLGGQ